ncbi:hypothetical protein [Vibrio owensii]|uniref:Uncharacterized protein n=1 Tax=Vibrio owensii CAIM 1854 = LMG 25443 TaxID=1229493 RepID=A0A0C1Z8R6_9VIBR|nr:hypothetical protein [Vibrio owensii]KIF53340.1 hypothetical protein H735_10475 [Vibrio owensii CAIM 1854 = LMG 25443]
MTIVFRQVKDRFDLSLFKSTNLLPGYGSHQNLSASQFEQINALGSNLSSIWLSLGCLELNFGQVLGTHLDVKHHEHTIKVDYKGNILDENPTEDDIRMVAGILPQLELITKMVHQKIAYERPKESA